MSVNTYILVKKTKRGYTGWLLDADTDKGEKFVEAKTLEEIIKKINESEEYKFYCEYGIHFEI